MKKVNFKNVYFIYTVAFAILTPLVFMTFIVERKSFVWSLDGLDQHYQSLLYYGRHLRAFLMGKGFPMFDFSVGMGYDVLTTLSYYVIGDPIALLSIFMTKSNGTFVYTALILFRFYLSGLSFCYFMGYFYEDKNKEATILGALLYIFSGYALFAGVRHPFFMNPMIYLPLLLVGMEKVLRRKKPYLLIGITFISATSNFYFFYALSIMVIFFVIVRYVMLYYKEYKNPVLGFFQTVLLSGGYYALGIGLASFLFIPVIYAFTRNGRLKVTPGLPSGSVLYYEPGYYLNLLKGFFAPDMYLGYWSVLSFSAITVVSIAIILCNHKYWKMKIVFLFACIGLCIPFVGIVMNGFSYDANRWCFLISFIVAVSFSITYRRIYHLNLTEKIVLFVLVAGYGFLVGKFPEQTMIDTMSSTLILYFFIVFCIQTKYFKKNPKYAHAIVIFLTCLSFVLNGVGFYSPLYNNYASQFLSKKGVNERLSEGVMSSVSDLKKDTSFYRVDTFGDLALNESLSNQYNGISSYFSLMDKDTTGFMEQLENTSQVSSYRFHDLDSRSFLEALCGVKYYLTNNPSSVPYGFLYQSQKANLFNTTYVYENNNAVSLGSMYHGYITAKEYEKLNALQKQSLLLQDVSLNNDTSYAKKSKVSFDGLKQMPVNIEGKGVRISKDGTVNVKANSKILFHFDAVPNSETYIRLHGLKIAEKENTMSTFYAYGNTKAVKSINVKSSYYNSYFGKNDYLVNLGYATDGQTTAVLYFPTQMNFKIKNFMVYTQTMDSYDKLMLQRNKEMLQHIKNKNNEITAEITANKKGILLLNIPYSKGFTAYVDGKKVPIYQADTMFMGLKLKQGHHQILLKYKTPYLLLGSCVSLLFFLILCVEIWIRKKRGNIWKSHLLP